MKGRVTESIEESEHGLPQIEGFTDDIEVADEFLKMAPSTAELQIIHQWAAQNQLVN